MATLIFEEEAAYTNLLTPASLAATSIFKKPSMLDWLVLIGSSIDRGTLANAAWCRTQSVPSQALRQSFRFLMSGSIK